MIKKYKEDYYICLAEEKANQILWFTDKCKQDNHIYKNALLEQYKDLILFITCYIQEDEDKIILYHNFVNMCEMLKEKNKNNKILLKTTNDIEQKLLNKYYDLKIFKRE